MKDQVHRDELSEVEFTINSEVEMDQLGQQLAAAMQPGVVVALVGELGAGKTRLVRAVAIALGADPQLVNSPTFVLVQHYEARVPIFHCDTYRLRDADEFLDLGVEEVYEAGGVCFIEWADRVEEALPSDVLRIKMMATGVSSRQILITATGPSSIGVLKRLNE